MVIAVMLVMVYADVFDIGQKKLVLSSASTTVIYNGQTVTDKGWQLNEGELKDGHSLTVNVSGAQTNVGMSENHISARVLDANGVDVTEDYNIVYKPGVLNVKSRDIGIVADSAMKIYDGTPLESDKYTLDSALSLVSTHTLDVVIEGSITKIGEAKNEIKCVTITVVLGVDVTRNYNVNAEDGKLIVYDENTVVIKTDGDYKEFDGTALKNDNWELVSGNIVSGHTVNVNVTGSRVAVGTAENTFDVSILDENGNDVTSSYDILKVNGKLTVIPAEITIISNSAQKVYDKTPLTDSGYTIDPAHYEYSGFMFEVIIIGTQTEVGESYNTIADCKIYTSDGSYDVTENFEITYKEGTLKVTQAPMAPVEIVFASAPDSKTYDGTPLTNGNWQIKSGTLLEGHSAKVKVTGTITDAGIKDNTFEVKVTDINDTDVTEKYDIKKEFGELKVLPIDITVTAASAQKAYDGEALVAPVATVSPAHIAEDYTVEYQVIGSQIAVGSSENLISYYRIYDKSYKEITNNFNITKVSGLLTVVESEEEITPKLNYSSGGASKIYDGTPLTSNKWSRTEGELLEGHREVIQMTSSITETGKIDNEFTVRIFDEFDNDVTDMYDITCEYGTLEVTKRPITIKAEDDSKKYDGTPLENGGVITEGGDGDAIVKGDKLDTTVIGKITEIGSVDNNVSSWGITNSAGEDVSHCYDVTVESGTLKVTDPNAPSGGAMDMSGQLGGGANLEDQTPLFIVTSSIDDTVYLKLWSYGDYNGKDGWNKADEYVGLIQGNKSAYYLTSYAIGNSGASKATMTIDPVMGTFALPYYASPDSYAVLTQNDANISRDMTAKYTLDYYSYSGKYAGLALRTEQQAYEDDYYNYVRQNYMYVDPETKAVMLEIIKANGFDKNNVNIINQVAAYIQNAAKYNAKYNEETGLDDAENMVVDFLTVSKQGVCRHYASAATLLFRTLGIPARYTEGVMDTVKAGEERIIVGGRAHAWVEVYIQGIGWMYVEVTGSDGSGNGGGGNGGNGGGPMKLTLTPQTTRYKYSGNGKIFSANQVISGFDELTKMGYSYKVVISGTRKEPGITKTSIESLIIYDPSRIEVYNSETGLGKDNFTIKENTGTLQVYREKLTYQSLSDSKVYDGTPLVGLLDDINRTGGKLPEGYSVTVEPTVSITYAGSRDNQFNVVVRDKDGNIVTDEFYIVKNCGTLQITPRDICVQAGSDSKAYDGTPLTCHSAFVVEGSLVNGDRIEYSFTGSQTIIGESNNNVEVTIYSVDNKDVTNCYNVEKLKGTLTVTMPSIG